MVTIGRLGRSLGLHLLLASQRLDEGRLRGLESHLSYRIALRTFSASESRAVLGVPDAHQLPPTPGLGVPRRRAPTSWCGSAAPTSPARRRTGRRAGGAPRRRGRTRSCVGPVPARRRARRAAPHRGRGGPTVLETIIAALAGQGAPAHRVWLPPLDAPPPLDELLGVPAWPGGARGTGAPRRCGPVGLVDRPYLQRRDPLVVDLSGASGHLAVVGGPRAGKSSGAARRCVLGLALTHTPGRARRARARLRRRRAAAARRAAARRHGRRPAGGRSRAPHRRRAGAALGRRERLFREAGVALGGGVPGPPCRGGVRRRARHRPAARRRRLPRPARRSSTTWRPGCCPLAAQGLAYGLHLAVSATRW